MTATQILKKHGIEPTKTKKANDALAERTADIVKEEIVSKGPSRNDLMLKAKAAGIKNFRILNKEELFQVLDHPGDAISIVEKAVARWKSGWGSKSKAQEV